MNLPFLFVCVGLSSAVVTAAMQWPRAAPQGPRAVLAIAAMVRAWLAPQWVLFELALVALGISTGAWQHPAGRVGIALLCVSSAALSLWIFTARRALPALDGRVVGDRDALFDLPASGEPFAPSWTPSFTLKTPAMREVNVRRSVVYREVEGRALKLDVYTAKRAARGRRPAVLYIHGGGWAAGVRQQSRYMHHELAADGSVVFSASYRFAPWNPLPAAITDVKAAVAWIRAHADEFDVDPSHLTVIGSSAGGHLAAMVALSGNVAEFQPGFETADTRAQAAVLLYGVYDCEAQVVERRDGMLALWLRWVVLRASYAAAPGLWRVCSPLRWADEGAPPVLVAHGTHDGLVSPSESDALVAGLRGLGCARVHDLTVSMGTHGFEAFPSAIEQRAVRVIAAFVRSAQGRAGELTGHDGSD